MRRSSFNPVIALENSGCLSRQRASQGAGEARRRTVSVVRRLFAGVAAFGLAPAALFLLWPRYEAYAWGPAAHRLVNTWAIATLPPSVRPFFEANRPFFTDHANDPDEWIKRDPYERTHHYIYLDKYGLFPYLGLPYSYKQAVAKFGGKRVSANGTLPWRIGEYSLRLTNDLQGQRWEDARLDAVVLAHFVADAHDPLHTTQNFDGHLTDQPGLNVRFGSSLIDRYSSFFMLHPEGATKIDDPTTYAFQAALEANTWVERILWADWRARAGLSDYTDEYFDRFYNRLGSMTIQEISAAAHDTGSYWYTAWLNAGQPALPAR